MLQHTWINTECTSTPFCTGCGSYGSVVEHTWVDATCETARHCSACGEISGEPRGHNWLQISCKEPIICTRCDKTTTENITHSWVFVNCTTPRYCSECELEEPEAIGHLWEDATCNLPKICSTCKLASGKPLGHNWLEPDCENPKRCSRCPLFEGEALGHNYILVERLPSTCSGGHDLYVCHCGSENIVTYPSLIDYHICSAEGLCSGCGVQFDVNKMTLESIVTSGEAHTLNCGIFKSRECANKLYKPITVQDIGLPIISINGDLSRVPKSGYETLSFSYTDGTQSFDSFVQMRIQGASSANYPKKNYSIKLVDELGVKNKVKLVDSWGREHKYCMKANWVDYSQARNVVSAQIFGDVVKTQGESSILYGLPSGGAIDGFPVVVFNNGAFHGLYTMNIPKDKWMFDMKDSDEKTQAIVMAEHWGDSVAMRTLITGITDNWTGSSNWELEFASNEESLKDPSTRWVADSLNKLIDFVINNDGQAFIDGISQYADVDKCIDSMIYTFFICADDNISKNILWVTYDGTHWFSSVYDMDGTWGLQWNGNLTFKDANTHLISELFTSTNTRYNLLWQKLFINFYDRVAQRYKELRGGPLSMENITLRFESFFNQIPDAVRNAEKEKWTGVPSQQTNNLEQILDYAEKRIQKMDALLIPR